MDVLVGRLDQGWIDLQAFGQGGAEAGGVGGGGVVGVCFGGEEIRVAPHWLAVGTPMGVERPTRKLLARVMLAEHVLQCGARRP